MLHTIKILCSVPNSALSATAFIWSYKPISSLNLPLNIQGKICNIFIHCDFQCSFQLDMLNRYHVILQLFPGELGITGYLTACITPCTYDGRFLNCFICAKWESSKELRNDGTLSSIEMCGNILGKLLNVFDKGWEGKGISETFQWKPEHFAWEILWHCLLGAIAQRWCSSLCSLTRFVQLSCSKSMPYGIPVCLRKNV